MSPGHAGCVLAPLTASQPGRRQICEKETHRRRQPWAHALPSREICTPGPSRSRFQTDPGAQGGRVGPLFHPVPRRLRNEHLARPPPRGSLTHVWLEQITDLIATGSRLTHVPTPKPRGREKLCREKGGGGCPRRRRMSLGGVFGAVRRRRMGSWEQQPEAGRGELLGPKILSRKRKPGYRPQKTLVRHQEQQKEPFSLHPSHGP